MSKPCQHAASGCDYPAGECIGECKTAQPTDPVPAGWKLVPVEPTRDMIAAAAKDESSKEHPTYASMYAAMLAAAPQPPVSEPVAWVLRDANNRNVKFLEWTSTPTGYRGEWIKTPLYARPQPRQPLTDEQIEALWRKWIGTPRPNY